MNRFLELSASLIWLKARFRSTTVNLSLPKNWCLSCSEVGMGKSVTSTDFSMGLVSMVSLIAFLSYFFLVSTTLWTHPLACSDSRGPLMMPAFKKSSSFSLSGSMRCMQMVLCFCAIGLAPSFMYISIGGSLISLSRQTGP